MDTYHSFLVTRKKNEIEKQVKISYFNLQIPTKEKKKKIH